MSGTKSAILLFELGKLQVFHFQTPEEVAKNEKPKEVFWQDMITMTTYGPFDSIYNAMSHYTWVTTTSKVIQPVTPEPLPENVISVDFVKRVKHSNET